MSGIDVLEREHMRYFELTLCTLSLTRHKQIVGEYFVDVLSFDQFVV